MTRLTVSNALSSGRSRLFVNRLGRVNGCSETKRYRIREVTWFSLPFSLRVRYLLKWFFQIVEKNFPKGHKYYSICNRSCIKFPYSVMPNFPNIIAMKNRVKLGALFKEYYLGMSTCLQGNKHSSLTGCYIYNIIYSTFPLCGHTSNTAASYGHPIQNKVLKIESFHRAFTKRIKSMAELDYWDHLGALKPFSLAPP